MKRFIQAFILVLAFLYSAVDAVSQNDSTCRTEKDIKNMIKKGVKTFPTHFVLPNDSVVFYNLMATGNEVSVRQLGASGYELNAVEENLLQLFDDVLLHSKFTKCYFICDDDRIGVCKFDGTILVPPVTGVPRLMQGTYARCIWIGDEMPWKDMQIACESWSGDKNNVGWGQFKAALNKKTLEIIVPYGQYDFIAATHLGYNRFQVCREVEGGYHLWGIVNHETGDIEVPCVYSNLTRVKGHHWEGNNDDDYYAFFKDIRDRIVRHPESFQYKWYAKFANAMKKFGETCITLDETLRLAGVYDKGSASYEGSGVSDNGNGGGHSSSHKSNIGNARNAQEQRACNTDKRTYSSYETMVIQASNGTRQASASEINNWKKKMRSLRTKWEEKGYPFPKSQYE